jgi:hypothetical protein
LEVFMKRFVSRAVLLWLFVFCTSTVWAQKVYKPSSPNDNIIGNVQTAFEAQHGNFDNFYNEAAYIALLSAAKKEYQGNIDIRDITWVRVKRIRGSNFEYSGNGKVIILGGNSSARAGTGIEGALSRAAGQTLKNVPARSRIAIVYITAQDRSATEYIAGELEFIWVNAGYTIIDRSQLDRIRREQNFQMSGEVDDDTAVSIGKIIGADIIVTGRVDGEGNLRRLRLRALNTQTAQVVGVASEPL